MINISYELIALYVLVSILLALICFIIGQSLAIRDDIKSVLYDQLERENNELKDTIRVLSLLKNNKKQK